MNIPDRKEYLKAQASQDQKIMGVLPALYPKALLWAFGILPAELWDPPGDILHANAHLQTTICPVVKRSLEFILKQPQMINTGYLFPHTCDSLQNLATQVKDLIGVPVPVYTFYNPKAAFNKATRTYYTEILTNFKTSLEEAHGALDQQRFLDACELGRQIDTRHLQLHEARMANRLDLKNLEYFKLVRAGEYMQPGEYLALLKSVAILDDPYTNSTPRLLVSGILPPDDQVLELFDELGVSIVAEDLLSGSRRIPIIVMDPPSDPIDYLTERFFLLPPCSTRAGSIAERINHIKKLISESQSQGVLFNIVKFCEPELFDHPSLVKFIKDTNLLVLTLETELHSGLSGQEHTRIEAFTEILLDRVGL